MKCLAFLLVALTLGCQVERHFSVVPETDQILRAESGDRFIFDLNEDPATGGEWMAECDDADVDVIIRHGRRAEVQIRVHRGYDGPSAIVFSRQLYNGDGEKKFAITLFKRTADRAFWE